MFVNKADGWGSVALQTCPPSWSCDKCERSEATGGAPNPESEFCEVIGWILLHGVAVVLHWLVREAFVGKDSHRERGQSIDSICFLTVSSLRGQVGQTH